MKFSEDKKTRSHLDNKGFTLFEIILVLALAGGVFLALFGIFGKTISNDEESRSEVIASNLAQEGIEIVRNIRDENVLNSRNIDIGLSSASCYPYWDGTNSAACDASHDKYVEKVSDKYHNCLMGACGADQTIFERTCSVTAVDGDPTEAFAVSCVVEWTGLSGIDRSARAMSILTDWQKY